MTSQRTFNVMLNRLGDMYSSYAVAWATELYKLGFSLEALNKWKFWPTPLDDYSLMHESLSCWLSIFIRRQFATSCICDADKMETTLFSDYRGYPFTSHPDPRPLSSMDYKSFLQEMNVLRDDQIEVFVNQRPTISHKVYLFGFLNDLLRQLDHPPIEKIDNEDELVKKIIPLF